MDIPLNAEVLCSDGVAGWSTCLIVNPINRQVTHVVVKTKGLFSSEVLVPARLVSTTTPTLIQLQCTRDELKLQEPFIEHRYVDAHLPGYTLERDGYLLHPYVTPEDHTLLISEERIPPGELGFHRGAHVEATDGRIGRVGEFVVDPADDHITHFVLREGHLWAQKNVTIPVSAIKRIEDDVLYLNLSKQEIAQLPAIPVRRWYRGRHVWQ